MDEPSHRAVRVRAWLLVFLLLCASRATVVGQLPCWQTVTLDFHGPQLSESSTPSPFLDHRLDVRFLHAESGTAHEVPGYFAADGDAGETGSEGGDVWRVRFTPELAGTWTWRASFRLGPGVAVDASPGAGQAGFFNGQQGTLEVLPTDPGASGFAARGRLAYVGGPYWRTLADGRPFLKLGANSPENLLAFADFDQTPASHRYEPHLQDWSPGDPAWHDARHGRALIGALNHLASVGMNAVYMLTFNVGGDGDDVWPWTAKQERLRFDCSKLDQWAVVLDHMDTLGLVAHLVLQETEIDDEPGLALDDGDLGVERMLYHRELVARFGHKLGLVFNLGEENQNTTTQQLAFAEHIRSLDGGRHPQVLHTYPGVSATIYEPLLEAGVLEGASLQVASPGAVHGTVLQIRQLGLDAGRPLAVSVDEVGPPNAGVVPDSVDPDHDVIRRDVLWGALMGGAAGVEWYFGYAYPHDDLDCEDWRSREAMWRQTALAGAFFRKHLPFDLMEPADHLLDGAPGFCLAKPGEVYAVYLPEGGQASIDLRDDIENYRLRWYDPRDGGDLQVGGQYLVQGPGWAPLHLPPSQPKKDWVALLLVDDLSPTIGGILADPSPLTEPGPLTVTVEVSDPDDDVAAVAVHLLSPGGASIATLHARKRLDGLWVAAVDTVPQLQAGIWTLHVEVLDGSGHHAASYALLEVL